MFYFIHILLMCGIISFGQNDNLITALANSREMWQPREQPVKAPTRTSGPYIKERLLDRNRPAYDVTTRELKKFYIGFSEHEDERRLISLEIHELDSLSNVIRFKYTLNSKVHHWVGEGRIDIKKGVIDFDGGMSSGKVYRAAKDGKIIFEALGSNSLSYWIIKEK